MAFGTRKGVALAFFGKKKPGANGADEGGPPSPDGNGGAEFSPDAAAQFFRHAKTMFDSTNYDYALQLYIRGLAIDPEWPHDQAMATEPDWPHDSAMIAPLEGDVEQAVPLFDKLLGALESDVRESKVRQLLEDWLPGKSN